LAPENQRKLLWRRSLEICFEKSAGPTMNVMGLLPLAAMKDSKYKLPENTEKILQDVKAIIYDCLDRDHFKQVLAASRRTEILDVISRDKCNLFPFNYR
jgi:hypothetical protein